ncbi:MAG: MATE family efflux transporter [Firmicutes bacterium]|nr:MATE family efflux transporter [Bacillota bacterium]
MSQLNLAEGQTRDQRPRKELGLSEIRSRVLRLAGPALVEQIFVTLVGMVDMMMVGRLGPAAVAAVGLANQPVNFALGIFIALNVGTTAVVARSIGAEQPKDADHAATQSAALTLVAGAVAALLGLMWSRQILVFMGADSGIISQGLGYMRVVSIGFVFMSLAMNLTASLRGAGEMKTTMVVNIVANIVNILGNYVLIYGNWGFPRLGVLGAGIATTFARMITCLLATIVLLRGNARVRMRLKGLLRPDLDMYKRVLHVGWPAAIEQLVLRSGQMVFVRTVAGLGTVVFAAHQIGMNIMSLSFMLGQAFGASATTLVGQSLGAQDPPLAEKCAKQTQLLAAGASMLVSLLFWTMGRQVVGLYTNDPEVTRWGALVLKIIAFALPFQTTQFVLRGALRGAGDTTWPLYATAVGVWGFRVALAYLLGIVLGWGLVGVWLALTLDQMVRALIITWRFRQGKWKYITV